MFALVLPLLLAAAVPASATAAPAASPIATSPETRRCLVNRHIRAQRSTAENGYFARTQQGWWFNNGPTCPSFGRNRALVSYRPTDTQCRGDVVNVVDPRTGVEFGNCMLGEWQRVEDAKVPPARDG
jgi:hypothetical protein